jgi:murein L,D-transpeptidase YcbB/YkuD
MGFVAEYLDADSQPMHDGRYDLGTAYEGLRADFYLSERPMGDARVDLAGIAGDTSASELIEISLNNTGLYYAYGMPASRSNHYVMTVPADVLRVGTNTLAIRNHSTPPGFSRARLSLGDSGDTVLELQRKLNDTGASLITDGIFGAATEEAVKEFQRRRNLNDDGIVGPLTWSALIEETGDVQPFFVVQHAAISWDY